MSFTDRFLVEILTLHVAMYQTLDRLKLRNDDEALHDMRIAARRIRSLLRPFRSIDEVLPLSEAAAEVGRHTSQARDLEVIIHELEKTGFPKQAQSRKPDLDAHYSMIIDGLVIKNIMTQLDDWPTNFRRVKANGGLKNAKKTVKKALRKQLDKLHSAVDDAEFDRHKLRIMVKRTRYLTEAFPELSPLSKDAARSLKKLQSALGTWHDHYQWCLKAEIETDLRPLEQAWLSSANKALETAEAQLLSLTHLLPRYSGKIQPLD